MQRVQDLYTETDAYEQSSRLARFIRKLEYRAIGIV